MITHGRFVWLVYTSATRQRSATTTLRYSAALRTSSSLFLSRRHERVIIIRGQPSWGKSQSMDGRPPALRKACEQDVLRVHKVGLFQTPRTLEAGVGQVCV